MAAITIFMSRNYLEAFVIVIVAAGFGFFLTWPKLLELRDIEQKINEKIYMEKSLQEHYSSLEKISMDLGNYKNNLLKIKSAFPTTLDSPALMSFIQATAMQSGLVLKGVEYSGSAAATDGAVTKVSGVAEESADMSGDTSTVKNALRKYNVSVSLMGSYNDFKGFLSRIERSSRLIEFGQISIESAKEEAPAGGVSVAKVDQEKEVDAADQALNYSVSLSVNYYE